MAIACVNPDQEAERPISQFTAREIADETVKRKIVPSILSTTVWSSLKSGRCATAFAFRALETSSAKTDMDINGFLLRQKLDFGYLPTGIKAQ